MLTTASIPVIFRATVIILAVRPSLGPEARRPRRKLAKSRILGAEGKRRAADRFAANVRPIIEQVRTSGIISLRSIAAALTARGVATARGGEWTAVQVSAVERRVVKSK